MWGIIPAAGSGSRIQPLAFSKELLPVGSRQDGLTERPRAVSEYLVERLVLGGATKLCFIIAPGKSDILEYYRDGKRAGVSIAYMVQPQPTGLCDALFQALPLISPDEFVLIGLPDTIWLPREALSRLGDAPLSFLLFPVEQPQYFDAVVTDSDDRVLEVQVKHAAPSTSWIWGAIKLQGLVFHQLHQLWCERERQDEFLGTLINAWIARGGDAVAVRAGEVYVDVGTLPGYRRALRLLHDPDPVSSPET